MLGLGFRLDCLRFGVEGLKERNTIPEPVRTAKGLGLGFRVFGFVLSVECSGFRVQRLEFRVQCLEFRVEGSELRVSKSGFRVWGLECRASRGGRHTRS